MEEEILTQEAAQTAWAAEETSGAAPEGREEWGTREENAGLGSAEGPGPGTAAEAPGPGRPEGAARPGPVRAPEELREELREFMDAFPGVRGEEVPREVWDAAIRGSSLTLAYSLHKNRSLERELADLRQDRENRRRSTGSMARNVPGSTEDLISMWWNEAD